MIEYKAGRKMVIGICDDDKKWRESCKRTLIGFSTMIDMDMEVMCFSTAEELLEYKETPLDAVFLDIELGRANGIFVAKKLNKVRPNCKIIYMTNYLHYATEIYNTEHIWFVIKSKFTDKIGDIIGKIVSDMKDQEKKIVAETKERKKVSIAFSDILYIERDGKYTKCVTVWGVYTIKRKFDEIAEVLSGIDFSRCHNSYIVNFRHVREAKRNLYTLYDGQIVYISKSHLEETKADFLRWSMMYV